MILGHPLGHRRRDEIARHELDRDAMRESFTAGGMARQHRIDCAAEQRKVRWPELLRIRRGHESEESLFLGLGQARGWSQALGSGAEGHEVSGFEGLRPVPAMTRPILSDFLHS